MANVNNKQVLEAILALTDLIKQQAAAKEPEPKPKVVLKAQPETEAKVKVARATFGEKTVSSLPEVTELPDGVNPKALMGAIAKTEAWRAKAGLPKNTVATVLYRNQYGQYKTWGYKMEAKAPNNAIGIIIAE